LPNGAPLPVPLSDIQTILSGSDRAAILALAGVLGAYNSSGDTVPIDPSVPQGPATPGAAKAIANIPFADCP